MLIKEGEKYLVNTDNFFRTPDGESCCSAWGTVHVVKTEDTLGFTPARPSTNWFLRVGSEENHIIIAGCQIHYLIRCETRPIQKEGFYKSPETGREHPINNIYFAE